jgi:hypothetical protein
VSVQTYTPWRDAFETDANSQFNMNVKFITNPNYISTDTFQLVGELDNVPSGTNQCMSWPSLEQNADYEWYAEVSDGENTVTSPVWSFTTNISGPHSMKNNAMTVAPQSKLNPSKESFVIYPNPNNINKLTISFKEKIKGKVSVQIFSMMGNLVLEKNFVNIDNAVSFEHHLPNGTYTVLVQTEKGREVRKIVVLK